MDFMSIDPQKQKDSLLKRIDELRNQLRQVDPETLARNTAIQFEKQESKRGEFKFQFLKQPLCLDFPGLELIHADSKKVPNHQIQALVFYYFRAADGSPLSQRWISFSEIPNGLFYNQAFQGYTGSRLVKNYQNNLVRFSNRARSLEGVETEFGDTAFRFQMLPRLPLLVAAWQGDEDFPASYKILFDASISHYLPTDACAIAGSMLTGMLLKE